jgi:hypothetical protein
MAPVALVLALSFGLLAACGGGSGDEDSKATAPPATGAPTSGPTEAAGEPTAAPTAEPTEPGAEAPEAAPVELEPGVALVEEGSFDLAIAPRGSSEIDPLALAGDEAPACAGLVFAFSWQVQDPYPPDGVQLRVTGTRMGATVDLGEGPAGTSSIGCFAIEFISDSDIALTVQIRYAAGSIEG